MPSATDILADLFRYNAWANAKVFEACRGVEAARLEAAAPGTHGSIDDTLKHMVGVEDVYLVMLQDQPIGSGGNPEDYFAHDLTWFDERSVRVGESYLALLPRLDDAQLASSLKVPWFDFPLTKRDGLIQVLTHSGQHRAQVLSVLGAAGIDVPSIDYVLLVQERQRPAAG
jgi:uncharacterized damage-inducible protein DinB